jgi:hypothetical protein
MTPIRLLTRTGDFVKTVLVPLFHPPAEAILWGSRYFIRRADGNYYEGLVYAVPPEHTTND